MNGFWTLYRLTLDEARRRRILLATLLCGLAFLSLFGFGFFMMHRELTRHGPQSAVQQRMAMLAMEMVGLYAANFLTVMTAVLMPVDTISGEIGSGVMQTLASKPVRRSTIVLAKWLAHATVVGSYLLFIAGGVVLVARVIGNVLPPGLAVGLPLMFLEGLVVLTLCIAGGTRLSTITNGIVVLGFYGLAFVGGWTEQIGTFAGNETARYIGTVASLIMPSESMWQLACWHMQPALLRDMHFTPFSPVSVPNTAMVLWAAGYVAVTLGLAVRGFARRGL